MVHVVLHACPIETFPSKPFAWNGKILQRLDVPSSRLTRPFALSFDDTLENLRRIERVYAEADGSLLWTSHQGPTHWQIDGQLNDSANGLMSVELKISYSASAADASHRAVNQIISTGLRTHPDEVLYQLVRQGVYVTCLAFS